MSEEPKQMSAGAPRTIKVDPRYIHQNATIAIQNVYDALIELITNADDRYEILGTNGEIHIGVERKRKKGAPSIIRVRDFADGMTIDVMKEKLCQLGKRVSGMAEGYSVRGTNSRGAKDVAVLGGVTFESIAQDGQYHKCEITARLIFIPHEPSLKATSKERRKLQIRKGTGTLVTITVDPTHKVPQHEKLKRNLRSLVALREIVSSKDRRIILRDLNKGRDEIIEPLLLEGKVQIKARFLVPGYPQAEAKLIVKRAPKRFDDLRSRFRHGGILIKSRHGVHQATYFDQQLENDPHAAWFFGKLTCEYIDDLWNDYDDRWEKDLAHPADNPCPIVDPFRKNGLRRDHPFTKALFQEALKRFRPLVEAERKREEKERVKIESEQTRKRLNSLERAAAKFMQQHLTESDTAREPDAKNADSTFLRDGYTLNPPFAQIVQGHSLRFWLNVQQQTFPELSVGDSVEISCLTDEISSSKRYAQLEPHPTQEGVLRCIWLVKGERPTKATGIQVRVGPIVTDRVIEVLESERNKYEYVKELCFNRKRYSIVLGRGKAVHILAPYPSVVEQPTPIDIVCSDSAFNLVGKRLLMPRPDLGVAICKLRVDTQEPEHKAILEAKMNGQTATSELSSVLPAGAPLKISIEPEDFGNQRYRWQANTLQIAAKHPAICRYLGPVPPFPNQEEKHFRVILAEIVAEAVCQRVLGKKVTECPEEYQEADWDAYYADYSKLMTEFLPIAHALQVKDP